ncbi:amino acid adenylation domain-containing protein [Lysobacter yananisis]|uniref:Amino acid adenylation domain-containing protein n=1 Tax=Lysobacter yananisis TaxID=1003114 RepID=A0ABY9P428_9GAMM|nr:non-ribosomal peptide synthetase [Lysobacter yananisis]WMT01788.1 amino acid adenylation domain-containing protein [Lysobacter yananisis]
MDEIRTNHPIPAPTDAGHEDPAERGSVHALFERQAQRTPHAPALEHAGRTLSYAALDACAERLARRLRALGVVAGDRVAICAERGFAPVVAMLATLKAGAAYLPLDPDYPRARLHLLLDDAAPAARLYDAAGRRALGLDDARDGDDRSGIAVDDCAEPAPDPAPAAVEHDAGCAHSDDPQRPAYVIYTSGSTGRPKGVAMAHAPLLNLLRWQRGQFGAGLRTLQFAALGFDVSFQEIFGALCDGATLVVAESELRHDFAALARALYERRIQRLHLPYLALSALADALADADDATVAGLREHLAEVIVAGEQLRLTPAIRAMFARLPSTRLHNHYGPTETHVVSAHVLGPGGAQSVADAPAHVPIGRAVAGVRLYLLDPQRRPVRDGDSGELWIGGAAPALGYLHQDELSAQRFPADPFDPRPGARMYRSGDLARRLPGGELEFLGRNDEQVKIRGFRVEPGEIAAQLAAHPRVREAAAVARAGADGALELVAYAAPAPGDGGGADFAAALREHLRERLPEPLRPAAIVVVAALPRSAHGKLDRAALPPPDDDAYGRRDYRAPRPGGETELARLWQELLGRERIGRDDDFFALGGHSLSAARLLGRLRRQWRVELPVSAIWQHPTLAAQAAALDALRGAAAAAAEPPQPGAGAAAATLSSNQRRLWFLSQLDGIGGAYHIALPLRLRGALDVAALRAALDALSARHAGLRSRFVAVGGEPRLQLAPETSAFALRECDLRGAGDAALRDALQREAETTFDLERGPPARALLARSGDDEFHLLLTLHHLVADGESLRPLARDLSALYAAFVQGRSDPLPPLPWQFPDYAAWQQRRLDQREAVDALQQHWRTALADAPALLDLPTRQPRPPLQSFDGALLPLRIEPALAEALRRRARRHGTSLFALVLAAWALVLSRLSGQSEVVVGAPNAQRDWAGSEALIGFFVDTLALRIDLSGEPDADELIERARRSALDAQDHALPFERVVEALNPPRRADRTPLFQAVLAWQGEDEPVFELPGIDAQVLELGLELGSELGLELGGAKFDLELQLGERAGAVVGGLRYATALFAPAAIERHRGYLLAALRALAEDAPGPVAGFELIGADERRQLLHDWNRTDADYPREACFHHLFERQAKRSPEAVALEHAGARWSYAALDAAANRLAHRLIAAGVGPDRRVALCAQRGADAIVAILAVFKAGGAYVPLDPAHASARFARVLADAAPVCALTDEEGRRALTAAGAHGDWPLFALDDPALVEGCADTAPQRADLGPQHLAYIVYTSGSTGDPKGVMVEHRQLVQFAHSQAERFGIGAHSRIAQFASLGFDASLIEIGLSLSRGAALCVPGDDERADAGAYLEWIARERIGLSYLPPAFLQGRDALPRFQTPPLFLVGGEAVPPTLLRMLQRGGARPVHVYGPTETTVLATAWEPPPHWSGDAPAPIGRPLANTRAYVLDAQRRPLPLGAPGELYLGGAGVARGYLGRAELDAERYFPDPFDPRPGARMYRSGDTVRYREDGELLFLGRDDGQVKLRGYRIELGEIQARLREHPAVREAAVLLREDEPGRPRLVAYVVAAADREHGEEFFAAALRAHLAERLPDYMLPAAYVRLQALPLTAGGKLERRALPAPAGNAFARGDYAPPQGELETLLAQWWQELLAAERIGRDDDFFELGGHSLLAMRLLARLREELDVAVAPSLLFRRPRLAGFAEAVLAAALQDAAAPEQE